MINDDNDDLVNAIAKSANISEKVIVKEVLYALSMEIIAELKQTGICYVNHLGVFTYEATPDSDEQYVNFDATQWLVEEIKKSDVEEKIQGGE